MLTLTSLFTVGIVRFAKANMEDTEMKNTHHRLNAMSRKVKAVLAVVIDLVEQVSINVVAGLVAAPLLSKAA